MLTIVFCNVLYTYRCNGRYGLGASNILVNMDDITLVVYEFLIILVPPLRTLNN